MPETVGQNTVQVWSSVSWAQLVQGVVDAVQVFGAGQFTRYDADRLRLAADIIEERLGRVSPLPESSEHHGRQV